MNYHEMRDRITEVDLQKGDDIFKLVRSIANFYQNPSTEIVEGRDLIIRLVDRRREFEKALRGIGRMIDAMAREAGLHPYMQEPDNWRDELARNYPRLCRRD